MDYDDFTLDDENEEQFEECEELDCDASGKSIDRKKDYKKTIEVEEVLGIGNNETNLEVCIPICPPAFEILEDLIEKTIKFDALIASKCKVFINGRIIKNIPFKTKQKSVCPPCDSITKITFGTLRHVTVEVPFSLCIEVPKSEKGAKVVVLESNIQSVELPSPLPCKRSACDANQCVKSTLIRSLTEKMCVYVKVKVVKDKIICIPAKDYCDH